MENAAVATAIKNDKRIVFLDYLRIFAFASVLLGHKYWDQLATLSNNTEIHSSFRLLVSMLLPLIHGGGVGVVIFFLISGYIITLVLQTEKSIEFIIKRIFRIYPLYIAAVLIQYALSYFDGQSINYLNLLLQLTLMGDFFGTPYALGGVEWTLRVEMLFYVYMAILNSLNLFKKYEKVLPYIYILTVFLCAYLSPIPSADIWSKGYLTIYGPFLLLGSVIYLHEKKTIGLTLLFIFSAIVFYQYFNQIATYQTSWIASHFALLAFIIFFACWLFRKYFVLTTWTFVLSDLTYAVYLFHNWLFEYIKIWVNALGIQTVYPNTLVIGILLFICFVMVKLIEKPGIRLGRIVLKQTIKS